MTHVRAAARLAFVAIAYTARIWFEDRHARHARAYIDKTRPMGGTTETSGPTGRTTKGRKAA